MTICNQMWSKMTKLAKNGQLKLRVVKGNLGSCQTRVIFRKMIPDGREWPLPCLTLMWLPYFKKSFKLSWVTVRNHVINQKSSNMYCVIPLRLIQYLDMKIIGSAESGPSWRKRTIFWPKADDLGESRRSFDRTDLGEQTFFCYGYYIARCPCWYIKNNLEIISSP